MQTKEHRRTLGGRLCVGTGAWRLYDHSRKRWAEMFACSASCMILTGLVSFRLHCWLNFLMPLRQLMGACTLHFSESESDTSFAAPPSDPKARRTAELRAFLAEIGEAVEKDDDALTSV